MLTIPDTLEAVLNEVKLALLLKFDFEPRLLPLICQ